MITLGVKWISLSAFLPVCCLVCAVVSVFTGTSWGTVGTLGLALMAIGASLDIPPAITAGAVVSGAWFGDKISPLSDTTNYTAAVAGTDLVLFCLCFRVRQCTASVLMGLRLTRS